MPKVIDVKLVGISADGTGGNAVKVSGRIFGVTLFQNGGQDENRDIFAFPDGPVTVTEGQVKGDLEIRLDFSLNMPSDPF